jgi:predicted Zn-dependent protease
MHSVRVNQFERSITRVFIAAGGAVTERVACEGEFGRIADGSATHCFSGPPPTPFERLPRVRVFDDDVEGTLQVIENPLTFTCRDAVRRTIIDGVRGPDRRISTWSLMVRVGGRWLGWSGAGSGVAGIGGIADEIYSLAAGLQCARAMNGGRLAVVLSQQVASVVLHESIGHMVEGDVAAPAILGRRLAAECVTVYDDATASGAPCGYGYDDENTRALGPTRVVEEGVVVAQLHSSASAVRAGTLSTANARAASAWQETIPRVSNLVCEAGTEPVDALVERCGEGLYIHRVANGIKSGMRIQADVVLAERIKDGRRTGELLTGGRIDENASLPLRIIEVGADARFNGNAMCGKSGQLLFDVGTSAPPMRVASMAISG